MHVTYYDSVCLYDDIRIYYVYNVRWLDIFSANTFYYMGGGGGAFGRRDNDFKVKTTSAGRRQIGRTSFRERWVVTRGV